MGLKGQGHQEKRHKVLMCDSHRKYRKENLQNPTTKFPRKGSENHEKSKIGETTKALRKHAKSSIHTKKGSYKV
jgi:hypothetical protein